MKAVHNQVVAKCPQQVCGARIDIAIGRFPGGENDHGGLVVECAACGKRSYILVANPCDASEVTHGGRVIHSWDEDIEELANVLAKYGLTAQDEIKDRLHVIPNPDDDLPLFCLDDLPIYHCTSCDDNLEVKAYGQLAKALSDVNSQVQNFLTVYLKGYAPTPKSIEVQMQVRCKCASHRLVFHKSFCEADALTHDAKEFLLAGPNETDLLKEIDGIFTRDDCIAVFKKMLLRWRARDRVVLLVVPFIGLDYPGREKNRVDLWDLILRYTDPARTILITRRKSYNDFLKAAKTTGMNLELLRQFNVEAPLLRHLGSDEAFFKQQSHAKFYAAVGPKTTEVLTGSFNIHTGGYAENLIFKEYSTPDFITRYLVPLEVIFDFTKACSPGAILSISVQDSCVAQYQIRDIA